MMIRRYFGVLLLTVIAPPIAAQRGVPTRPPVRQTPPRAPIADTSLVRRTPAGFVLDFQNQDLRVVLSALAEAGALNVSLSNIPQKPITLRMGQPVTRDTVAQILRAVAESNGLTVKQLGALMTIEGPPPVVSAPVPDRQVTLQQMQAAADAAAQMRLYTYRLKHASAVQLAPVLTSLFTGTGFNAGNVQVFPGGVAINGPGGPAQQALANLGAVLGGLNAGRAGQAVGGGRPGGAGQAVGAAAPGRAQQQAVQQLAGLSSSASQIRIVAEETSNSLLVRATESDWALVQQIIQGVDLRPLQVLIEVTIAE